MLELIAQARAAIGADELPVADVLGHWFTAYLSDAKPFVVSNGHALRFLAGEVNRYGLPNPKVTEFFRRGPPPARDRLADFQTPPRSTDATGTS